MNQRYEKTTTAPAAEPDRLISKAEVARLLSLSSRTVDRLCSKDQLKKIFVGSSVRFRLSDVLQIIENGI